MDDQVMIEPLAQKVSRLAAIHAAETALKLRLVGGDGSLTIDENTAAADLIAAECISTDYTPGGYTITFVTGGVKNGETAYNRSGLMGFTVATVAPTQEIHGAWVDMAGAALQRVSFDPPIPLARVGDSVFVVVYDGYPPGVVGIEIVEP